MLWSSTGYQRATTALMLCSIDTQCKFHKDKVQNKSQMDGTEQCWGWDKMAAIFQKTFSNTFSWMKIYEFQLRFHWSLFLRVKLTLFKHWFRLWLGADQATSHHLNQWRSVYWCIYVSLGLNDLRQDYKRLLYIHDDVIKWKHFPPCWPFVWGIHRSPVIYLHKGQWREL